MALLDGSHECQLARRGYGMIAGIDEAGRGCFAGPVVAAAVIFDKDIKLIKGINDSKKISPKRREVFCDWLTANFDCGVGIVDAATIDSINILQATRQAMMEAVGALRSQPDFLLVDALKLNHPAQQEAIVKGDAKIWSIAAASIVAKVTRDRLMAELAEKYPGYGFEKHKGYGTAQHREALEKLGICQLHRKSYRPIREVIGE